MSKVVSVEVDTKRFDKMARLFPRKTKIQMGDALDNIGRKFLKKIRSERLKGSPGIQEYSIKLFKTFRRTSFVTQDIKDMGMKIWSESPVAIKHQKGGPDKALDGQRLAIPIPAAKSKNEKFFTKKGRIKKRFNRGNLGSVKGFFEIKTKLGKEILFRRLKGDKDIIPVFVLKDKVQLKSRLGFFDVWDDLENFRINRINKALDRTLESL